MHGSISSCVEQFTPLINRRVGGVGLQQREGRRGGPQPQLLRGSDHELSR